MFRNGDIILIRRFFFMYFVVDNFIKQVRVSAVLSNAPFVLNLDYNHYINNSKAIREAMCFMMEPLLGKSVCFVQFSQRFDAMEISDQFANQTNTFVDVCKLFSHSHKTFALKL